MQLLGKSLCGDEIACELISILSTELGISGNKLELLACMRDRSSSNNVALRTVKILYPQLHDIGCYSHTIDHVGETFVARHLYDLQRHGLVYFHILQRHNCCGGKRLAGLWLHIVKLVGGPVGNS